LTRILIVKTSSLGDIVHALPVVDDIHRERPAATIDWIAEEALVELPRMHPGVHRSIPVALRRWRRSLWAGDTRTDIARFDALLRRERYDRVIDLQGLAKSALIVARTRGIRCGYDWRSAREPIASLAYHRRFGIDPAGHAIARNRALAAAALGYHVAGPPTLRLSVGTDSARPLGRYVVALHATSAEAKLWPEASWRTLLTHCAGAGLTVVLPWGSAGERLRSERLALGVPAATVPPRLSLPALASVLAGAEVVVGVDTGLVHLAAALGVAVVALYRASDPALTGVSSFGAPAVNLGSCGRAPGVDEVIVAAQTLLQRAPPC
jgi:heptosyltransferase-1